VLDWNPQGARRRGRPKKTWKRTTEDEAMEAGKTWSEVKRLDADRIRWRCFTDALCSRGSNRKWWWCNSIGHRVCRSTDVTTQSGNAQYVTNIVNCFRVIYIHERQLFIAT
jgi:hypothetical protein